MILDNSIKKLENIFSSNYNKENKINLFKIVQNSESLGSHSKVKLLLSTFTFRSGFWLSIFPSASNTLLSTWIYTTLAIINCNNKEYVFDLLLNCTGLFSDRNFKKYLNKKSPVKIIPFRGEYFKLKKNHNHLVNDLIYPVPNPRYPFLGVHFTRMINGDREVGPNAVLAFKREGYSNKDFSINQHTFDLLKLNTFSILLSKTGLILEMFDNNLKNPFLENEIESSAYTDDKQLAYDAFNLNKFKPELPKIPKLKVPKISKFFKKA